MLDPGLRVETARDGFLYVRFASQVALRLYYSLPADRSEESFHGLAVASRSTSA